MRIEEFDPAADDGKVNACYQMYVAGLPVDDPDGPPMSEPLFAAWMREGWSGERRETALAADSSGAPVGLLVKVAMLDVLAGAEPALRRILTENADSNQHMIGINASLGFEVLDEWQSWQLEVAAVPQARPAGAREV